MVSPRTAERCTSRPHRPSIGVSGRVQAHLALLDCENLTMEHTALLQAADRDGNRLLAVAAANWQRPVPRCPACDAAEFVRHTGGILSWMSAVVESTQRVSCD